MAEGWYTEDMQFRTNFFVAFLVLGVFVLPQFAHAAIPFFGPIIPGGQNVCPAGWGMFMTVINNIISFLITIAIVFVAPIMIAYSGFLMVMNQGNAGGLGKAKEILTNTILGIIISLAGWMIVDMFMAVLYNPGNAGGTWSSLITSSGDECLSQAGSLPTDTLNPSVTLTGVDATGSTQTVSGSAVAQCSGTNSACSPSALQAAGLTTVQANIMSCIAVTESSGNPATPPYNVTHPNARPISTACGTFQITQTTWNQYASGACSSFSNCMNAACNMQVAKALVTNNGYTDWTCKNCNSKAASCIQQYGG